MDVSTPSEKSMTATMPSQNGDVLTAPAIAIICIVAYLLIVTIIWFVRKCLVNQGMCKQCQLQCDCCLWLRDCCIGCGPCCQSCSVHGCLDSLNCPRQRYYCTDLICCRCLCPDNSPCVNCCDDMASGSCECCGCQLNFSMAAQTARSPRQQMPGLQQPGYGMYPNTNPPVGFAPRSYLGNMPQPTGYGGAQQSAFAFTAGPYPPVTSSQAMLGQIPKLNVRG